MQRATFAHGDTLGKLILSAVVRAQGLCYDARKIDDGQKAGDHGVGRRGRQQRRVYLLGTTGAPGSGQANEAPFDELYARTAQVQYFALVGKVGREAADDLLQELYLIAWENIASVRPRSFVGYLNATARNLCLRHFKRQGTSKEPTPAEDRALEEIGAECGDVASDGAVVADPSTTVAARMSGRAWPMFCERSLTPRSGTRC